jgi:hypothetical protein
MLDRFAAFDPMDRCTYDTHETIWSSDDDWRTSNLGGAF